MANPARYAKDLLADRDLRFISRTFPLWVAGRPGHPVRPGRRPHRLASSAALTGLLWGGAVRMLLLHHVTFSINSLCHFFGRRPVRHRRRVAQPRLAGPVRLRRGLAQQPPRLPDLGPSRPRPPPARLSAGSSRPRALPPGLGRGPDQPRTPAGRAWIRCPPRHGRLSARLHARPAVSPSPPRRGLSRGRSGARRGRV